MLLLLDDQHRQALRASATRRTYRKNTLIIAEGDDPGSVYLLHSGRVRVFVSDAGGRELTLGELGAGELFGEQAAIQNAPRSASIVTIETCELDVIGGRFFKEYVDAHPALALDIARLMSVRIRELTEAVRDMALLDVSARVERALAGIATPDENGALLVRQVPTQQEIANRVGASREMVSKVLKSLYQSHRIERCREGLKVGLHGEHACG